MRLFFLFVSTTIAFDIVAISHKEQVVETNLANICPCEDAKLPCYDANAPEGKQCVMPFLTDQDVAQRVADGDPAARCSEFVDCIELVAISANQQRSLVPKQLLERSRLAQFKDEQAPVLDKYGIMVTRGNTIPYSRWTYIGCFSAQDTDVKPDAQATEGQQAFDPNECRLYFGLLCTVFCTCYQIVAIHSSSYNQEPSLAGSICACSS